VVGMSSLYFGDSITLVNAVGICLVVFGSYR
jgi:uncharacterized membrane protein